MMRKATVFTCLWMATLGVCAVGVGATTAIGTPAPAMPYALAATGQTRVLGPHSATLEGTITPTGSVPAGSSVRVYFELGTTTAYELQSVDQSLPANTAMPVHASLTGLQSNKLYHYRLVAVDNNSRISIGADHTFSTAAGGRLIPRVEVSISPVFKFTLPDTVRVSGAIVPPSSLSTLQACKGFVDILFRVRKVAIQTLRAGVKRDCSFKLPVRFSNGRRLHGGSVSVEVLFAGNRLLQRRAAPVQQIQIGH